MKEVTNDMMNSNFLVEARTAAGMTLGELAAASDLSLQTVSKYEHGLQPSAATAKRLEKALRLGLRSNAIKAQNVLKALDAGALASKK
jgi:transcriptional regulator with XRE-family HTH domain